MNKQNTTKQELTVRELMENAKFLLEAGGISGNQLMLALDKLHESETGKSLLALTDIHLETPASEAEPEVINYDGKLVVSSRNVADVFGKEHFHVIRDIRDLLVVCSQEFGASNFGSTSFKDQWNREQPEYLLTKDGLTMLVMGYTGAKAMAA